MATSRRTTRHIELLVVVLVLAGALAVVAVFIRRGAGVASGPADAPPRIPSGTPAAATQRASTAPADASLTYILTLTDEGNVSAYRVTLPADWESKSCRGNWGPIRPPDDGNSGADDSEMGCTVEHWPDGRVEIDLAADVTDSYSRVTVSREAEGYSGTFKGYSAFTPDDIRSGSATLVREKQMVPPSHPQQRPPQ